MTNRDAIELLEEVRMLDDTMYAYNPNYMEALDMALNALEAEETWYATHEYPPKTRWIPCSERLPEPDERVLVYTVANEYHVWDAMPHRADSYAWEDEEGLCHSIYEVDLWMPLPDPWEGEKHGLE